MRVRLRLVFYRARTRRAAIRTTPAGRRAYGAVKGLGVLSTMKDGCGSSSGMSQSRWSKAGSQAKCVVPVGLDLRRGPLEIGAGRPVARTGGAPTAG